MKNSLSQLIYRLIKFLVRLFFPHMELAGTENLPKEPCIIVSNHCQMYGPIAFELYSPRPRYTWCAAEMMDLKEVPAYAYQDFWSKKPKPLRPFYKLLSYLIAPLSVCVFNNADTIPTWHDAKVKTTFRMSVEKLEEGADLVIFPEHYTPHNQIIYDLQEGFVDVARMYHKKSGRDISFVPVYLCPALRKMIYGKPIPFKPENAMKEERARICNEIMDSVTEMALALPPHTVVPYPNMAKKDYPRSR